MVASLRAAPEDPPLQVCRWKTRGHPSARLRRQGSSPARLYPPCWCENVGELAIWCHLVKALCLPVIKMHSSLCLSTLCTNHTHTGPRTLERHQNLHKIW